MFINTPLNHYLNNLLKIIFYELSCIGYTCKSGVSIFSPSSYTNIRQYILNENTFIIIVLKDINNIMKWRIICENMSI